MQAGPPFVPQMLAAQFLAQIAQALSVGADRAPAAAPQFDAEMAKALAPAEQPTLAQAAATATAPQVGTEVPAPAMPVMAPPPLPVAETAIEPAVCPVASKGRTTERQRPVQAVPPETTTDAIPGAAPPMPAPPVVLPIQAAPTPAAGTTPQRTADSKPAPEPRPPVAAVAKPGAPQPVEPEPVQSQPTEPAGPISPSHTAPIAAPDTVHAQPAGQVPELPQPLPQASTQPIPATPDVPVPGRPMTAPPVAQVASALVSMAQAPDGTHRMTLRLDPPELGHVQIRIDRSAEAPARVEITVERTETLHLLLRDQPQLQRALDQAGVPPEGRSVTFHVVAAEPAARTDTAQAASPSGGAANTGDPSNGAFRQGSGQQRAAFAETNAADGEFVPVPLPGWIRAGLDITA